MKTRLLTAAVGIPIVLACVLSTSMWPWVALLAVVGCLALPEGLKLFPGAQALLLVPYVVGPLAAMAHLQQLGHGQNPAWSWNLALLVLLPLWAGDSAGYFVGRAIGKHKLAPVISPKKTWEGAIANFLACVGVCAWLGTSYGVATPVWVCAAFATGIFGQAGDLFESWLKRKRDLKDSGSLLPGHGGILDRIDSILFAAPLVWLAARLFV
ncbi:MAG: phosphatidate cytidylyltransferase [Chthonomonas sp.]|nr:phosphatidate cytidylyltransferase [Chthonomonas sp.]